MAQSIQLPCDGDGTCMVCKQKPSTEETLTCKTCVTPWHASCLSAPPETLAATLQWECPDCSEINGDPTEGPLKPPVVPGVSSSGGNPLVSAVRAIEADESLTEKQKAKKRQELLGGTSIGDDDDDDDDDDESKKKKSENDLLDLLCNKFKCAFCMQLPQRPVSTPCGHNFCLQCFQKWIGQGKRTCAKCRSTIPLNIANRPTINASIVESIRLAKTSRSVATGGPSNIYRSIENGNRPDKAFTTERAKRGGKSNACRGKVFVNTPPDHFGPIPAGNDPVRNQGVLVGECWADRSDCAQWGVHYPPVSGIAGQADYGAQSVVLSGGYQDDEDHGEWFLYTGSGGRDLSGNKRTNKDQCSDQQFAYANEALRVSCRQGYPVRVVRSHKEKRSSYAPRKGLRYDGVYRIEKCWRKVGVQGLKVCRYLFVRCDNEPAPWISDVDGDRPRPLPVIKELREASDVYEREESPAWDYAEEDGCWKWKKPPPASRKKLDTVDPKDMESMRKAIQKSHKNSVRTKLLQEFSCLICKKVMNLPLTTPCAHNFCKRCLEDAFTGQSFVTERICKGGRTLRAKKNIMKCPACPTDISDFLKNPQVNRELMDVIESLQHKTDEEIAKESSEVEIDMTEEKSEDSSGGTEAKTESSDMLLDDNENGQGPQVEAQPKKTNGSEFSSNLDGVEETEKPAAGDKPEDVPGNTETGSSKILVDGKKRVADESESCVGEEKKCETEAIRVDVGVAENGKSSEILEDTNKPKRNYKRKTANDGSCMPKPKRGARKTSKKAEEVAN